MALRGCAPPGSSNIANRCLSAPTAFLRKSAAYGAFSGKVEAGLPQENAPAKIARILIAKPAGHFCGIRAEADFFRAELSPPPLTLVNHIETIP
jgi:hypothetical protein